MTIKHALQDDLSEYHESVFMQSQHIYTLATFDATNAYMHFIGNIL